MRPARLALRWVFGAVLFALVLGASSQAAACAAPGTTFTAIGNTNVVDVHTCDVFISDTPGWAGLFTANNGDAYSFFGIGEDPSTGAPLAQTFTTANATYQISGDFTNDHYSIKLVTTSGTATSDTISLFTCPSWTSGQTTCITTQSTTIAVNLPVLGITTASLPPATAGVAYSQSIAATNAVLPDSFTISAGALPAGLTLSSAGVLSGTPTAAGSFNFTVKVTDSRTPTAATATQAYTFTVNAPVIAVLPTTLPNPALGSAYSQSVSGSGGTSPYSFVISGGALPAGLTLSTAGLLSGTPTVSGPFSFTVRATDSTTGTGSPFTGSRAYSFTVTGPVITVTPATLPGGTAGAAYSQTEGASGSAGPFAFSVSAGTLPTGLSLNSASGAITGTPTAVGSFNFTVQATDSTTVGGPFSGTQAYTVAIAGPTIVVNPTTLPNGTVAAAYNQTITTTGGTGTSTFAVTGGALPAGVSLSTAGVLSGTPTAGGTFNFTVTATDQTTGTGAPFTGSRAYGLVIAGPTIALSPGTLPGGTAGTAYSQSVSGSGGTAPYTFAVTAGSLPAGLSLSSAGALTGTSTAAGTFNFTITATDHSTGSGPFTGSQAYSVVMAGPNIVISPASLPNGADLTPYNQSLSATGANGVVSFAVTGGTAPTGLTLSPAGVLSGTPTATGTFNFTVTATDQTTGTGAPFTGTKGYSVTIGGPTVVVSPGTLPGATAGAAYSQPLSGGGGVGPYTFAVTAGALPAGLTLSTGGSLAGTPTAAGSFNFTVTATDSSTGPGAPFSGSQAYTLIVAGPTIVVSPSTLPAAAIGGAYSQNFSTTGGDGASSFAVTAGALPAGLTLSTAGVLSGTPTAAGSFNFTVTATDQTTGTGAPFTGSRAMTLTVNAPTVTVAPGSLPAGTAAVAYSQTVTGSGGTSPYTFAVTAGALPAGLSLSSAGAITGTPTAAGSFNLTITATDHSTGTGAPFTGSTAYTLVIAGPTIVVAPSTLPGGTDGTSYSQTLSTTGGTGTSSFAVTAGALPAGVTLSTGGVLSGTPTAAGSFNFTVTATDQSTGTGAPFTGNRAYTLAIAAPTVTVSPGSLTGGTVGQPYTQTLSAGGGTAPYTFAVTSGGLPTGLTLSSGGGISGTPTATGPFSFTVTATDHSTGTGAPFPGSQAYTINVVAGIILTPSSFADQVVGSPVSTTVSGSGGTAPYTFVVTSGALPTGLTLAANGHITGTPNPIGTYNFTITATDSAPNPGPFSGSQSYTWHIVSPTITLSALPNGQNGVLYEEPIHVTGGTGPYSFTLIGSLPPGLSLSGGGVVSGTPTSNGSFAFQVQATDSSSAAVGGPFTGTQNYDVVISTGPPPSIPTLGDWWAAVLAGLLALAGAVGLTRRKAGGS